MRNLLRRLKALTIYYMSLIAKRDFVEYHSFPFNTLKKMPKGSEIVMEQCCNILESTDIIYRLADGTALGLYREGEFIPHDNDIDVEVLGDAQLERIVQLFINSGMRLGRKVIYKGRIQQLIFYTESHTIFDIVVWHKLDDYTILNYSERGYRRSQDIKFFKKENLDSISFRGKQYPIPGAIEEWLEMRYGNDWRVPKTYKGDWKEECFDMKKIGE
jgi:hypothetical protein